MKIVAQHFWFGYPPNSDPSAGALNPLGLNPNLRDEQGNPIAAAINADTIAKIQKCHDAKVTALYLWDAGSNRADIPIYDGDPSIGPFVNPILANCLTYLLAMLQRGGILAGFTMRPTILQPQVDGPMQQKMVTVGSLDAMVNKMRRLKHMFPDLTERVAWYYDSISDCTANGQGFAPLCQAVIKQFPGDTHLYESNDPASQMPGPILIDPRNAVSWQRFTTGINPLYGYTIFDWFLTPAQIPIAQAAYADGSATQMLGF